MLPHALRQVDQVKLVIVDLDDTLWRGVIAEDGHNHPMLTEGWPIGFVEAPTCYLKKRGVLLAIVSGQRNDEERIRSAVAPDLRAIVPNWSDFASVKIDPGTKGR